MALEYEAVSSGQKLIDDLKQSISFFDKTAQEITAFKKMSAERAGLWPAIS